MGLAVEALVRTIEEIAKESAMTIRETIDANWRREVDFLKALVRVPSDNPPGDCARAAEVAAQELQALGFTVERHPVPAALVAQHGMKSAVNLIVRKTFGTGQGPVIALNAHGDVVPPGEGWTVRSLRRGGKERCALRTRRPPCRSLISRPTPLPCWRWKQTRPAERRDRVALHLR